MIKTKLLALSLGALTAFPAHALETKQLAELGIQGAIDKLTVLAAPTDEDRMALGMFHFLRGVEKSLQVRYSVGIAPEFLSLPLMRLPIPENPTTKPFAPEVVQDFTQGVIDEMEKARAALALVAPETHAKLEVPLDAIWFDINANGTREPEIDLALPDLAFRLVRGDFAAADPAAEMPVVKFDAADRYWLLAYTHLLSGFAETVLTYDPSDAIAEVLDSKAQLAALNEGMAMANAIDMQVGSFVDGVAGVLAALDQEPSVEHATKAHGHFLAMVEANREFWRLAETETDNDSEWIPNDRQVAALGFELPQGTGKTWMAVLEDGEALLKGEKLLPYWRLGEGAGLNLKRMFLEPRAVDLAAWVQGSAALPYAEKGERVSSANYWRFEEMFFGNGMMFAVLLN